jgi:hypothetical protein
MENERIVGIRAGDDELRAMVDAWPTLPADIRRMIVSVVKLTHQTVT